MISKGQQWLLVLGGIGLFSVGGIALGGLVQNQSTNGEDDFDYAEYPVPLPDSQEPTGVTATELADAFANNEL